MITYADSLDLGGSWLFTTDTPRVDGENRAFGATIHRQSPPAVPNIGGIGHDEIMPAALTSQAPSTEDRNCTRCHGSGVHQARWVHHGVPGLCFACDGIGTRTAQRRKAEALRAEAERVERRDREMHVAQAAIAAERSRHGTRLPPKSHRDGFVYDRVFTTRDYATRNGLTPRQAFTELACGEPGVRVAFDHSGTAIGWIREI